MQPFLGTCISNTTMPVKTAANMHVKFYFAYAPRYVEMFSNIDVIETRKVNQAYPGFSGTVYNNLDWSIAGTLPGWEGYTLLPSPNILLG